MNKWLTECLRYTNSHSPPSLKKKLGDKIDCELFKYPHDLAKYIENKIPQREVLVVV